MHDNLPWTHITGTAAGTTTVVSARSGNLAGVLVPAQKTGTASFYDCAGTAGTSATSLIFDLPNTVGSIPTFVPIPTRLQKGLVVVVGGTTDFTVIAG